MIELYQAEWCPHSSRVRQRFTELGSERGDVAEHRARARPAG